MGSGSVIPLFACGFTSRMSLRRPWYACHHTSLSFWKTYLPCTTLQLLCLCIYPFSTCIYLIILVFTYLCIDRYRSIHLFIYIYLPNSLEGSGGERDIPDIPASPVTPILFQRQQMRVNSLDKPLCTGVVEREFDRRRIRRISRRKSASRVGDFLPPLCFQSHQEWVIYETLKVFSSKTPDSRKTFPTGCFGCFKSPKEKQA